MHVNLMHRSNFTDAAILDHYIDDNHTLYHYNDLVSFFCVIKIWPNSKEHLFQGKPFSGCYQIYQAQNKRCVVCTVDFLVMYNWRNIETTQQTHNVVLC